MKKSTLLILPLLTLALAACQQTSEPGSTPSTSDSASETPSTSTSETPSESTSEEPAPTEAIDILLDSLAADTIYYDGIQYMNLYDHITGEKTSTEWPTGGQLDTKRFYNIDKTDTQFFFDVYRGTGEYEGMGVYHVLNGITNEVFETPAYCSYYTDGGQYTSQYNFDEQLLHIFRFLTKDNLVSMSGGEAVFTVDKDAAQIITFALSHFAQLQFPETITIRYGDDYKATGVSWAYYKETSVAYDDDQEYAGDFNFVDKLTVELPEEVVPSVDSEAKKPIKDLFTRLSTTNYTVETLILDRSWGDRYYYKAVSTQEGYLWYKTDSTYTAQSSTPTGWIQASETEVAEVNLSEGKLVSPHQTYKNSTLSDFVPNYSYQSAVFELASSASETFVLPDIDGLYTSSRFDKIRPEAPYYDDYKADDGTFEIAIIDEDTVEFTWQSTDTSFDTDIRVTSTIKNIGTTELGYSIDTDYVAYVTPTGWSEVPGAEAIFTENNLPMDQLPFMMDEAETYLWWTDQNAVVVSDFTEQKYATDIKVEYDELLTQNGWVHDSEYLDIMRSHYFKTVGNATYHVGVGSSGYDLFIFIYATEVAEA